MIDFSYHPKCNITRTIPILFADDLLIFCKGDLQSVGLVKSELDAFSKASCLYANLSKSAVYFSRVDVVTQ